MSKTGQIKKNIVSRVKSAAKAAASKTLGTGKPTYKKPIVLVLFAALAGLFITYQLGVRYLPANYTMAYVEEKGGEYIAYKYNPRANASKRVFVTRFKVLDVIAFGGRLYFATEENVAFGENRITLPEPCRGVKTRCFFGIYAGRFGLKRAVVTDTKKGYDLDIDSYALDADGARFNLVGTETFKDKNNSFVQSALAVQSRDFDDLYLSLADEALKTGDVKYGMHPTYSGFYSMAGDSAGARLSGRSTIYASSGAHTKGDPFVLKGFRESITGRNGQPRILHVFEMANGGYKIAVDAMLNGNDWVLWSHFYIITPDGRHMRVDSRGGAGVNLEIIPAREYVLFRTQDAPYELYNLRGKRVKAFGANVILAGFVAGF